MPRTAPTISDANRMLSSGITLSSRSMPGLVVDAGVEEHVVEQLLLQRRPLHVLRQPAVAAPVVRHRAAAVRNDELQRREILEEVRRQELHERGRVAVDVVRAGGVEVRVARRAHVDHRRHVELDHLLVERIPLAVGQRRVGPVAARRIGVQVAADEAELLDAALELGDAVRGRDAGRLRQLADADEVLGVQRDARGGSDRCRSRVQRGLVSASPTWCAIAAARGEKIVTSVPRSRWSLSCAPSRLSRISSSLIFERACRAASRRGSFERRDLALRQSSSCPERWCSGRGSR